jgi:glycosyltransferase involved in cell wall biosynthesis
MKSQDIYFVGKRYYTNRDALREKFGRIYQLPSRWLGLGAKVRLWLIDYHEAEYYSESIAGLEVISLPLRRIQGWAGLLSLAFKMVFRKPAVVVASGDCYIGLLVWVLSRLSGSKFVFDVYDKYDEFYGYRRIFGFDIFRFLLKHSDLTLFASQSLLSSLGSSVRGDFVVPNGIDLERFRPMDKQLARKIVGLSGSSMLVGYFGSMEWDRGVDDLIQAVHLLRTKGESVLLVLGGKLRDGLQVDADGVKYVGNVPYEKIPYYLSGCDVLSIPYRRSEFMDAGSSNKIAESIAAGRPIVVTRTPNFLRNFPGLDGRLGSAVCECANPESLADALLLQLKSPILVDLPDDIDWDSIARGSLGKIIQNFKQEKLSNDFK